MSKNNFSLEPVSILKNWMSFHRILSSSLYNQKMKLWGLSGAILNPLNDASGDYNARLAMRPIKSRILENSHYVLKRNNDAIGTISIEHVEDGLNRLRITNVCTDKKYRGLGYGQKLLELTAHKAKHEFNASSIVVMAGTHEKVINAYENAGFIKEIWEPQETSKKVEQMIKHL